jgi:hypothetical protein
MDMHLHDLILVPVWDGHNPFMLSTYAKLPPFTEDIPDNSAVLLIFMVSCFPYKGTFPCMQYTISFNIQHIIVIALPTEDSATEDDIDDTMSQMGIVIQEEDDITEDIVEETPIF